MVTELMEKKEKLRLLCWKSDCVGVLYWKD